MDLFVGEGDDAAVVVLRHDEFEETRDARVALVEPGRFGRTVVAHPHEQAGGAALIGDGHAGLAVQQPRRVERVVDLFVLDHAVGVDARASDVEVAAHEREALVDGFADGAVVVGDLGDHGRVDAVGFAGEADEPEDERLDWRVAAALADAEQRAVVRAGAVQPGGDGVRDDCVQVILAVVLERLGGHAAFRLESVDEARECRAGGQRAGR